MKKIILRLTVFLVIAAIFTPCQVMAITCAELDGSYVISQDFSPVYLGFFGNQFASESIMNGFGTYGSSFSSLSVRNTFGTYGSSYSSYSANNDFTSNPPEIYKNEILIGYLTTNTIIFGGVSLGVIDLSCTFYSSAPQTNGQPPSFPVWVDASDGEFTDIIQVSWTTVSGASVYNVYFSETSTGTKYYIDSTTGTSMNIIGSVPDQVYYFWVTASNTYGEGYYGGPDSGYMASLPSLSYSLTANKSGSGSGSITSSPAGIDCGSDCHEDYSDDTMVELVATPDVQSAFAGWSGACSGTGTCQVTMDAAKSVTAEFNSTGETSKNGMPWLMLLFDY